MNEKILELKEEYERFLDTLPTLKDGENKDPITDWWIGKIAQAVAEEKARLRGIIKTRRNNYSRRIDVQGRDALTSKETLDDLLSSLDKPDKNI